MASKEIEYHARVQEKYVQVKKELKALKNAIEKQEKAAKEQKAKPEKPQSTDLFIERKDKAKADTDEHFDISPGDHVLVKL